MNSFSKYSVLVVGDVGMDIWMEGTVKRVSQEAPVPIVLNPSIDCRPAMAGNLAIQLAELGANVTIAGVVGDDENGELIKKMFECYSVTTLLSNDSNTSTITKTRILGNGHQLLRIDEESPYTPLVQLSYPLPYDGVIISDYDKGTMVASLIFDILKQKVPVFVDPKYKLFNLYTHATIVKANLDEAHTAIKANFLEPPYQDDLCANIMALLDAKYVVITAGSDGMYYKSPHKHTQHVGGIYVPVRNTVGAGDAAMAALALEYLHTSDIKQAVNFANKAGAVCVSKPKTGYVTEDELRKVEN